MRGAAEAAVSNQRDGFPQPLADQRARDRKHFAHSRASLGAFVTDDDHIAGLNLVFLDRLEGCFLRIENARGSGVHNSLVTGKFDDATIRSERSTQDGQAAIRFEGRKQRPDDLLALSLNGSVDFGEKSLARGCHAVLQQLCFAEALREQSHATRTEEIWSGESAAGLEVGKNRGSCGDGIEFINRQRDACIASDCKQVKNGIGGASCGRDGSDGVRESCARDDLPRANVLLQQMHHGLSGIERGFALSRVRGGDFVGAHGRNAQKSDGRGHCVRRELAAARACAGAGGIFEVAEFLYCDFSCGTGAHSFEDVLNRDFTAMEVAGKNRAAVQGKAGKIEASKSHHRAGNCLVTTAEGDDGVESVGADEQFNRVRDDFARN